MNPSKKYGLILSNKQKLETSKLKPRLLAFQNNESSDDEDGRQDVNSQIHKEAMKKTMKKQTKLEIQKVLEEDSTAYEYDSIYDDMKEKANKKFIPKEVASADKNRQPKYIGSLIKAAEARNRERQRIEERKIEKERRMEGDIFSDKPSFVTSAYKKRMEERQREEEEEQRKAAMEEALDVRKQKDLSGFYRHFLNQQLGEDSYQQKMKNDEPPEPAVSKDSHVTASENDDRDSDLSFSDSSGEDENESDEPIQNQEDHQDSTHETEISVNKDDDDDLEDEFLPQQRIDNLTHIVTDKEPKEQSSVFKKRTSSNSDVISARERYLQRKRKRQNLT